MRLAYYAGASTAAAAACLLKAFHQRPNFYSATVYLSQSNACLLVLTNLLLVLACSFMFALQRLLYGPLRPIEIEQLSEKAWYAVLDTLLAMPSFREDVGGWLLTMFVLLLAGKVWGWIGEGRVDVFEQQPPANPRLFHARLCTSLLVSVVFDALLLKYCFDTVVADPRPGMMVIFTFEFAILMIFSSFTFLRYLLTCWEAQKVEKQTRLAIETRKIEIREERAAAHTAAVAAAAQNPAEDGTPAEVPPMDDSPIEVDANEVDVPGWEEKRRYLFALEVVTDFIKLMIYIVFFTVSITFNGLPMHIMRDVYMTFASFSKRVGDYLAYRKATSDMNTRYPDATTEEIRGDACIVCRENMVSWEPPAAGADAQPAGDQLAAAPTPVRRRDEGLRAKKLPCGHILHLRCLKAWLERQQVCPTCRRPVVTPNAPNGPAAPGNPPAPGQAGQQQGQRPRARIFNLGPLRVGLLNAPQGQIQDFINRFQNPDAANQNGDQNAAGANQQGPNHLGLQVPYANGQAEVPSGTRRTGRRAQVPIDVGIMQMEQRIMQEAHNLGVDQQQLATLRLLEGEMARLRAQRIPMQQPVGMGGASRQAATAAQHSAQMPIPGFMPMRQPFMPPAQPEALQGNPSHQMGPGHENLPQGLVLPEGWNLMPLHRVGQEQNAAAIAAVPQGIPHEARADSLRAYPPPSHAVAGSPPRALSPESAPGAQATGPVDDTGSPLFVPTAPRTSIQQTQPQPANQSADPNDTTIIVDGLTDSITEGELRQIFQGCGEVNDISMSPGRGFCRVQFAQRQAAEAAIEWMQGHVLSGSHLRLSWGSNESIPPPTRTEHTPAAPSSTQEPTKTTWAGGDWSFDAQSNGAQASATENASAEGQTTEQSSQQKGYSGKGKAKAVEVEEVPDPDAGN